MGKRIDRFRFRKHDTLGSIEAEGDQYYLSNCFVDTGALSVLADFNDSRRLVVGRTGSGKTALLNILVSKYRRSIVIRPESLALAYISNSTILNFFMGLGVDMDTFFRLLWRHVFAVEIIQRHYKISCLADKTSVFEKIRTIFERDKKKAKALDYLDRWGCSFWEETENRIKEVTTRFENELKNAVKAGVGEISFTTDGVEKLTEEQKREVVQRAQVVVNQIQVRELSEVIELLQNLLHRDQSWYFVVIDGLDEKWVEDRLRYRLIRSLIETSKDFRRVQNVKIVAAIRLDLLDRVFRLTRDAGFQEEKFESLYVKLQWTGEQLTDVLDSRINFLVQQRFTTQKVSYRDVLPHQVNKEPTVGFLLERTMMRPRDIILFFNLCIQQAENRPSITLDMLRKAEGEYSRNRLRSLADEWHADYPNLLLCTKLFRGRPKLFPTFELTDSECAEFCLDVAIQPPTVTDEIVVLVKNVVDEAISVQEFRRSVLQILYKVGFVGLKLNVTDSVVWSLSGRTSVSRAEINPDTRVAIHPAFWRVMGVNDSR